MLIAKQSTTIGSQWFLVQPSHKLLNLPPLLVHLQMGIFWNFDLADNSAFY